MSSAISVTAQAILALVLLGVMALGGGAKILIWTITSCAQLFSTVRAAIRGPSECPRGGRHDWDDLFVGRDSWVRCTQCGATR